MQSCSSERQAFKAPPGGLQFGTSFLSEITESPASVLDVPTTTRDGKVETMDNFLLPESPLVGRRMLDNQADIAKRSRERAALKKGLVAMQATAAIEEEHASSPDDQTVVESSIFAYMATVALGDNDEIYTEESIHSDELEAVSRLGAAADAGIEKDSMLNARRHCV